MFLEVWMGLGRAWEGLGMAFGRIGKHMYNRYEELCSWRFRWAWEGLGKGS